MYMHSIVLFLDAVFLFNGPARPEAFYGPMGEMELLHKVGAQHNQ